MKKTKYALIVKAALLFSTLSPSVFGQFQASQPIVSSFKKVNETDRMVNT